MAHYADRRPPVVRRHGYLNKFLGDGVMFFYNAPMPNPHHARHACEAVLELQEVMAAFGQEVTGLRGLPRLGMRLGRRHPTRRSR